MIYSLLSMSNGQFSTDAAVLWGAIPIVMQEKILNNVYCVICQTSVSIVNFAGNVDGHGDLILTGSCEVCGQKVVRLLETAEIKNKNN